jgi:signal transduction histidine kinase
MRSIERLLLMWVLGALSLGAAVIIGVTYVLTFDELGEVFDENLKQVALATAYHHSIEAANVTATPVPRVRADPALPKLPQYYDSEGEFDFITLIWQGDGTLLFTSDPTVTIPFTTQTGISHLTREDGSWHVFSIVEPNIVVQAAQRDSSRDVLAAEVASKMFLPIAALVVSVGLLTLVALRRGLRPLDAAAASVARRTADTLRPVSLMRMPREIHPLVTAINDLLTRLSVAISTQKRFVADAAHELRTPVTALRLQLQLLERAADDATRREAITDLKAGVERSQHLIEQLLDLSRYEPDHSGRAGPDASLSHTTDLGMLARDVVAHMSIKAEHAGIDLGADAADGAVVAGQREQLLVLLNNLVENALRYTPRGGVVDVRVDRDAQAVRLHVVDNGPGIAAAERGRVFDRFYRGEAMSGQGCARQNGSGLGLAIVKAIADRHRAEVTLHTAESGRGLDVQVTFAASASAVAA